MFSKVISYSVIAVLSLGILGCGSSGGSSGTTTDTTDTTDTTNTTDTTGAYTGDPSTLRVYVAGESIEEFNHMNSLPFNTDGSLNGTGNITEEMGWMVPFAQKLNLREPALTVSWVGSGCWTNPDTSDCSTGTYTNTSIGHTSAIAGTTVDDWINIHGSELTSKSYCYDIAFAARGGNDLNGDVPDDTYRQKLRELILALDQGSNCRTHPIVYVTAHMLDAAAMGSLPTTQTAADSWLARQKTYYVDIAQSVVNELNTDGRKIRLIDMWTPFHDNTPTDAFPDVDWWTTDGSVHRPDLARIHREELEEDAHHPRRLASIYAGECVADQINLADLSGIE